MQTRKTDSRRFREEQQAVRGSMTPGINIYPQRRARTASSMQQCATVCSSIHTSKTSFAVGALCWDNLSIQNSRIS